MISGRRADRITAAARSHRGWLGDRPGHLPHPWREQLIRPVVRLGLHVLRQGQGDRPGLRRVGQHPHRGQQRGRQLLRPPDPVEEHRHRAQRVVDRHVVAGRVLEFLQHRPGLPGSEHVTRQQQHRQPVDGGQRRPGDHVGRAGADRGRAGPGGQPVTHPRVPGRGVHHGLLVAGHHVAQPGRPVRFQQGLAQAGQVAVAEDAEAAGEQPLLHGVPLAVLRGQEPDHRLGHGAPGHAVPPGPPNGSRGSGRCPAQLPLTQACAGSSQLSQARSGPGPAITFR